MKPLAIDLFCGLGGWTEGLLAENFQVIGFDIERHRYPRTVRPDGDAAQKCPVGGSRRNAEGQSVFKDRTCHLRDTMKGAEVIEGEWDEYPAQLVIQDVLTIHGKQFKDASLIVASPPCQFFSYCAMPWSRAKKLAADVRADPARLEQELALFNACFRIQREACEAAGRHIPLIVENVRGAIPWVGRSRWNYGSFHLWGDVPALMPMVRKATKNTGGSWFAVAHNTTSGHSNNARDALVEGFKVPGFRFDGRGGSFQTASVNGIKVSGDEFFRNGSDWMIARGGPNSTARKAASAAIAKIPLGLSTHIARVFNPHQGEMVA